MGYVKGTRLIFHNMIDGRALEAKIVKTCDRVLISRITLRPSNSETFPFEWERRQFPMTMNKAQGQSFEQVSVWLKHLCFATVNSTWQQAEKPIRYAIRFAVPEK